MIVIPIDHIIYGVPDLEEGVAHVERLLGVRPAVGGRHEAYGTHNALLSLGPGSYLEVMARDPDLPAPERGVLFGLDSLRAPRLIAWVLRREAIDEAATAAAAAGLGPVETGKREGPGGVLTWRLTDPFAVPRGGVVPFLISWGETPHPSATAPRGGTLSEFRVGHPRPEEIRRVLASLDAEVEVREAYEPRLVATIATPAGPVRLGAPD